MSIVKHPALSLGAAAGGSDPASERWAFSLAAPDRQLHARGLAALLPTGPADTLETRVRAFFAEGGAERLLVGALPFDRAANDILFAPREISDRGWAPAAARAPRLHIRPGPSRADYAQAVRAALAVIAAPQDAPGLEKVVLARALELEADEPVDPHALWSRLPADPHAARFLTPVAGPGTAPRWLVGATPELLVAKTGAGVASHPLAGSARRRADAAEDRAAAEALLASEKDRREHALVVEAILDILSPLCSELDAPSAPALMSAGAVWHLGTRIAGRLRDPSGISAAGLAALLHPTPAVAGTPRDAATALIARLEASPRGFYAGAVGWTDAAGDGAWHVSLRCAEVSGRIARLHAGAGVVAGSDPEAEAQETSAKLRTMLRALGVDEQGQDMLKTAR